MKLGLVIGAFLLSACAAIAPSAQFTKNGCTVDFKKACQYVIDQPDFALNSPAGGIVGVQPSSLWSPVFVYNGALRAPFRGSGADMICVFDTRTHSATEGGLDPSYPPLDDNNIEQLRAKGLCQ